MLSRSPAHFKKFLPQQTKTLLSHTIANFLKCAGHTLSCVRHTSRTQSYPPYTILAHTKRSTTFLHSYNCTSPLCIHPSSFSYMCPNNHPSKFKIYIKFQYFINPNDFFFSFERVDVEMKNAVIS